MDHGGGGGFGGGHGGFGGGHGGFGGGHGGFGGPGGPGGFGFGGPGFGGHGGPGGFGFGGPGPGPGGFMGPVWPGPGFLGPGPFVPRGGPLFAPWLDALAVTAVAAAVVAPYRGYNDGRHRRGMVVWTEDGREVSAAVNMLTVRLCRAQNLKKVQMLGKQDPYVRAKLYYDGHQIGECRSSTCRDGGKDPTWQHMSKSVFTFYVPATVTLDRLTLSLDVINENLIADGFIGTTGSIPLEQAADGRDRWWNVSTGGSLQAIVELVTNDNPGTAPNDAYARSSNNNNNYNNGRSPNPRVPVVSATPAQATTPGAYGAPPATASARTAYASRSSASRSEPQSVYTANTAYSSTQYRPPPVAPGAAAAAGASYGGTTNSSDLPDKGYAYNGAPAAVPEARAVPLYDGNPSAAYGTSRSGTYPAVPAYPVASTTASQQQQQPYAPATSSQHQQQQPYAPATSSQQQRYSQQQSNQYPQQQSGQYSQQQPNQYGYSSSRYST